MLHYVNLPYACFGVESEANRIVLAAPIAKWSIGKTVEEFTRWVESKGGTVKALKSPKASKFQPYPFQHKDIEKVHGKFAGRALIAWEQGLGKSSGALFYKYRYIPRGLTVIICPATLKENWRREAQKHFGIRAEILSGKTPPTLTVEDLIRYSEVRNLTLIINYDILNIPTGKVTDTWTDVLIHLNPQLIIVDESQAVKSTKTIRYKTVKILCRNVPRVLMLSGTPVENRPIELWPQINILKPKLFPSRFDYALEFCEGKQGDYGWDFNGASNLKRLNRLLLDNVMVRRRRKDVLKDLPPKTRTVVPLELSKKDMKVYQEAEDDFILWLTKEAPELAERAKRAEAVTRMTYLKALVGTLKLPQVQDWVETFLESEEKLILFGVHKEKFLYRLRDYFDSKPHPIGMTVLVDGSTPEKLRQPAFDRFNQDQRTRLLLGNVQAAGKGWNCTCTSHVALGELPWVPGQVTQAEARVEGIGRGTGQPINSYFLVAAGTIDELLCQVIQSKQDTVDKILDGKSVERLNIHSEVERLLVKKAKERK